MVRKYWNFLSLFFFNIVLKGLTKSTESSPTPWKAHFSLRKAFVFHVKHFHCSMIHGIGYLWNHTKCKCLTVVFKESFSSTGTGNFPIIFQDLSLKNAFCVALSTEIRWFGFLRRALSNISPPYLCIPDCLTRSFLPMINWVCDFANLADFTTSDA